MKLRSIVLACAIAFSSTACSTLLDAADLDAPDFTQQQATSKMEEMVNAHAKLEGADAGPLQTVCNYDDAVQDDEVYHCTTFVKNSSVVLYGDCTADGCNATGYDQVEKDNE